MKRDELFSFLEGKGKFNPRAFSIR